MQDDTKRRRSSQKRTAAERRIEAREGAAMQWNGQSGVREFRTPQRAAPDTREPDEQPRRICIGEVCEPLS